MTAAAGSTGRERGWDPLVRLAHWGIALAVLANGLVTEGGSAIHVWIGYAALSLLALRLLWGVIGTDEARFASFPPSLSAARAHVGDMIAGRHRPHRSHNPLGALMVYALWGTLGVVIATGIGMAGSPLRAVEERDSAREIVYYEEHGDYEDEHEEEGEEALEEIHEAAATLLLILAALHVAGVALETRRSGTNLVRGMTTGRRRKVGER